jgi:hypothetical protein
VELGGGGGQTERETAAAAGGGGGGGGMTQEDISRREQPCSSRIHQCLTAWMKVPSPSASPSTPAGCLHSLTCLRHSLCAQPAAFC